MGSTSNSRANGWYRVREIRKSNAKTAQKQDAYVRLGDSYFVTSQYWPALENYNNANEMGGVDQDYAHFQKAISYGFVEH